MQASAQQIVDSYTPFFAQTNAGGSYFGKGLVALAVSGNQPQATRDWIDLMVKQVPTSTGHYGESFRFDGVGHYTNVVCIPHLWEATLTYLSLMAAYSLRSVPRPELATASAPADCGCRVGGASRSNPVALLLLMSFVAGAGQKR